ncbi:hypothetical protein M441DRAFT_240427 [Trichoderma asperellum CBS 433.97]|uniref:ORP1 like protein n=1 Tax=Trichoderma asperellum (strain ATCC 204424 / CBS 433.97 / NBRC 101777) TaxID=1042311 RepID=A0A2T3Z235_TRIA4|nr:hypothetical protein M441DRAFT_240427 [Trichoderma asperellum CBS 433.97]PTB38866.1 hypothetical protein M441DRAFT_240427 [Trichoderma asperellum CBS 433.97]
MSIPVAEMPSIDAKLLEARNVPSSYGITSQPPSPPLTENGSAVVQSRSGRIKQFLDNSSTAILNWNNLDKPSLFGQNSRSDLITRPLYHRRATSAPVLASRFTKSASNALKRHHLMPSSIRSEMDQAVLKSLPAQAEAPRPAIPSGYPKLDAKCHVLSHQATRNGHTKEAVNRLHACDADLQSEDRVSDPASDTVPLSQQDHSMGGEVPIDALSAGPTAPLEEEPRCMFVDDCQTGSQLRKAISHLFGRNKACTLRIPKHVWVYYCRKHYQRIRYRNAKTYPLNQMHLVKMQITRLQKWSETNRRQGSGPYIRLWTLTLRKREQNRLDKEGGPVDEGDDDTLEAQNSSAAPEWVIQRLGTGYTTEQMLEVAERLHQEIEDGILGQVPEIEFLPDIVESDGGGIAKLIRTRKQIRTVAAEGQSRASKRKNSETADSVTQSRFTAFNQHGMDVFESPSRKRIRIGPPLADRRKQSLPMSLPSIVMPSASSQYAVPRTLPAIPRMQALPPDHAYGPDADMHGLSSSRAGPNGFYGHDSQPYTSHYQAGVSSAQSSIYQRDGDYQRQHQRLPSISDHLSAASSYSAASPYRVSGSFNENPNMPRPPHLRSYSSNVATTQSAFEYLRPISSSGAGQLDLGSFDSRATAGDLSYIPSTRGYALEQRLDPSHAYTRGWPQSSPSQQQNYYPSNSAQDHVARPYMDGSRAPTYYDSTIHRTTMKRAQHEEVRYGNAWPHTDQTVTRAAKGVRED